MQLIIYKATYGGTLTVKWPHAAIWPPVPHPWYSTFDKELLATYLAVHHLTYFLEGRTFTLYTDHKPLVGAISRKKTPLSNRQARHLSFISEFTTDVRHIEKNNVVVDCLSRPEITASLSQIIPSWFWHRGTIHQFASSLSR